MGFWIVDNLYCTTISLMLIVIKGFETKVYQTITSSGTLWLKTTASPQEALNSIELNFRGSSYPQRFVFFYSYRNDWLIRKSYLVLIFLFFSLLKNQYKLKCTVAWPWMMKKKKNQREDAVVWRRAMYQYISQPPMIDLCELERKRN